MKKRVEGEEGKQFKKMMILMSFQRLSLYLVSPCVLLLSICVVE